MLGCFPRLQAASACFSCSPPDLNFLDPYFIFMYMHYNHCHQATAHLQLNIYYNIILLLLLLLLLLLIESRWGGIFRTYPDRLRGPPSLLYNGYWVFPGGKGDRGVMLTTHPLLVPRLRKSWAVPPLTLWVLLGLLRISLFIIIIIIINMALWGNMHNFGGNL
jgi:hypothetical protein